MTLDEIKKYVQIKLNKNQNGWTLDPDRFNILLKAFNVEFYEEKVQKPSAPNVGYEFTKKHIDMFRDFKKKISIPLVQGPSYKDYSEGELPVDYRHYSSVYYEFYMKDGCDLQVKRRKVIYVKDSRIPDRLQSVIQNPTLKYPIFTLRDGKIAVYPKEIKSLEFTYLSKPVDAFYDYAIVDNAVVYLPPGTTHPNDLVQPTGTPSRTVELPYPENYHIEIADWFYNQAAIHLKDQLNIQLAEQKKNFR